MGFQRAQWHSGLTYQQTCENCKTVLQYTDYSLDFRPWYADGYVDCPKCKSHLRHNEKYAMDNANAQPKVIVAPVEETPVQEVPAQEAPVQEAPAAAPVEEKPAYMVDLEEQEVFVDAKPIEPVARPVFCVQCGNKFNENDRFCSQCGNKRG